MNFQRVEPIRLPGADLPVKGSEILSDAFGTVFIVAPRGSGKTNIIFHMIKHCIDADTAVMAFCTTIWNDANWKIIRKYLEKQGNQAEYFTSINEDGQDQIQALLNELREQERAKEEAENSDEEEEPEDRVNRLIHTIHHGKEDKPPKPKKKKYLAPHYLIIFDDISNELHLPSVVELMKCARHYKIRVIVSSQYLKDLGPNARENILTWLIFRGQQREKINALHEVSQMPCSQDHFWDAYRLGSHPSKRDPRSFLYVDCVKKQLRRNFDKEIKLPPNPDFD